jgi:hypothetical protein
MKMVRHQAIGVYDYAELLMRFSQTVQKEAPVIVGQIDELLLVAPRENMV